MSPCSPNVQLMHISSIEFSLCIVPVCDHRRGSNVSLTLDMCTPGCTEPYGYGAQLSPRDQSAQEYLRQGTHVLTPSMLHTRALDDQSLQSEFYVSAATAAPPLPTPHACQALPCPFCVSINRKLR